MTEGTAGGSAGGAERGAGNWTKGLNPEQRLAVEHVEGPALVLAGAGSGKTRVLTARIANLVGRHGIPYDRILAVTFTNKAAGEMRTRIRALLGEEPRGMWVGTFHALGARLLRRHAELLGWTPTFTISDAEQSLRRVKRTLEILNLDQKRYAPKAIRGAISDAKNQLITPEAFRADHAEGFDLFARTVAKVYPLYEDALKDTNTFDFDDLLVRPVELFETHPDLLRRYRDRFRFILVDEYQDTNRAQFRFLELLASEHRNLMVVGDDDQSIYGWRGADIRNILDFEEVFPGAAVVRLERNYRSTGRILAAANAVIRLNVDRKGKTLRTEREEGELLTVVETADERDEAGWIADAIEARLRDDPSLGYRSFAVLYRTNAQSRALEDAFRRRGTPYQIVGGVRFYERREIQDVLAYLRLLSNPRDEDAFDRIVNVPRRGIGATSQERLQGWARETGVGFLEAAGRAEEIPALSKQAVRALSRFAAMIQDLSREAVRLPIGALLEKMVEAIDLERALKEEGAEGDDRIENVRELIAGAMEFDAGEIEGLEPDERDRFSDLDLFLQQVALVADVDRHDPDADLLTLMTLHNAKGLEFPVVFLAGMEEGLFPLGRAYDEPRQLEEERRLFYVGVTRAEDKLHFLHARSRRRAGDLMVGRLSSFVESIPESLLERRRSERLEREAGADRRFLQGGGVGTGTTRGGGREGRGGSRFAASRFHHEDRADRSEHLFSPSAFDDEGRGARSPRSASAGEEEALPDGDSFGMELNQDLPRFVVGEAVRHATFGGGRIMEISGYGKDLRVTVNFASVGSKKLLVRYAQLEPDQE